MRKRQPPRERDLGSLLRAYRIESGMTQRRVAEAADITREYLASIESGRTRVLYPETFARLREVLGFPGWQALESMGYPTDAADAPAPDLDPRVARLLAESGRPFQRIVLEMADAYIAARDGTPPAELGARRTRPTG